jgi:hypothetical protein
MGRFLAGVGLAAMFAWLFRRRRKPAPVPAVDPAEELKRKLAETRAEDPAHEPEQSAVPLDERRRAVHDRARASIDEMRSRNKTE